MYEPTLEDRTTIVDQKKAAQLLGLAPATMANLRYAGRGPKYLKVGRLVRYRIVDIAEWLDSHTHSSTSETREEG